jgi:hypothetical protein
VCWPTCCAGSLQVDKHWLCVLAHLLCWQSASRHALALSAGPLVVLAVCKRRRGISRAQDTGSHYDSFPAVYNLACFIIHLSIAVFHTGFYSRSPFWLRKIITDPHIPGHVECPDDRYPTLNAYISELILGTYEHTPVA